MEKDCIDIKNDSLKMSWFMRGGISYTDVFKLVSGFSLEENSLSFNPNNSSIVISVNIIALILVCLINKVYNEIEEQEILLEEEDSQMYY